MNGMTEQTHAESHLGQTVTCAVHAQPPSHTEQLLVECAGFALPQVHPEVKLADGKALPLDIAAVFNKLVIKPRLGTHPCQPHSSPHVHATCGKLCSHNW